MESLFCLLIRDHACLVHDIWRDRVYRLTACRQGKLPASKQIILVWINSPGGDCVAAAQIYRHCAICGVEEKIQEIKMVSAQAADELLGIEDVDASFVFYYESDDVVAYSARSMGRINVQIIMEKLGGGGHLTMAGAQTKGITLEEGGRRLKQAIDEYYSDLTDKDEQKALSTADAGPVQLPPPSVS